MPVYLNFHMHLCACMTTCVSERMLCARIRRIYVRTTIPYTDILPSLVRDQNPSVLPSVRSTVPLTDW